jgi:hypothetical protein
VVLDGDCAPSYLEVLLGPLGAYRLLGLPMNRLSGDTVDLVEVLGPAAGAYADQAHLVREFRQFTGTTPTGFLARARRADGGGGEGEVNSVQDGAAVAS